MSNAIAVVARGNGVSAPSIIGEAPARIATGGKIRAGIQVLTRSAQQNPRAVRIYEEGVAEGLSFDQIDDAIKTAVPNIGSPLVPRNVPYFTVRRGDFAMPEICQQILDLYGEDRGDGVKRLYRFPVVFPADQWLTIMPHALKAYGSSQLKFWSQYSRDGRERFCMTYAPVPVDQSGRRALRTFGGRKHVARPENGGHCDPEVCKEYQNKQCNLTGKFIFFIPGVRTLHAMELPTTSFYSMQKARETLEQIAFMRGGRISGYLDGQQTFWMTKKLEEVPHIDDNGKPTRVKHWLIVLEAAIDPTRLLRLHDDDESRTYAADRALAVLNGLAPDGEVSDPEPLVVSDEDARATRVDAESVPASNDTQADVDASPIPRPQPVPPVAPAKAVASSPAVSGAADAAEVDAMVTHLGVAADLFAKYASKKYGAGWRLNANGVRKVRAEVAAHANDADGLKHKIEQELDVFA